MKDDDKKLIIKIDMQPRRENIKKIAKFYKNFTKIYKTPHGSSCGSISMGVLTHFLVSSSSSVWYQVQGC